MKASGCSEGANGVAQTIAGPSLGRHKNLRILECTFRISEGAYGRASATRTRSLARRRSDRAATQPEPLGKPSATKIITDGEAACRLACSADSAECPNRA